MNLCYHFHVRHSCRFGSRCRFVHDFRFDPAKTYYMTHRPITNAYARTLDCWSWVLGIDVTCDGKYSTFRAVPEIGVPDIAVANRYVEQYCDRGWYTISYSIINIERFMGFPKSQLTGRGDQVLALEPILCADLMRRVFDLLPQ